MEQISFENIVVTESFRLDTVVVVSSMETEISYDLWFQSNTPLPWDGASVALALATLCGKSYDLINFDFEVPDDIVKLLEKFTGANITCRPSYFVASPRKRTGSVLNFSGGFDSLAAKYLMPRNTILVSMDFGGRFTRERLYFEKFSPVVISTNLVETPFRKNSWSFMGIGSLLVSRVNYARYITFGGILEASPGNLMNPPTGGNQSAFPLFSAAGYENAAYVLGLTEVGTLSVAARMFPQEIGPSLLSLASPGEEKLYRKWLLSTVLTSRHNWSVEIPEIPAPNRPHFAFGENFAVDFLSLYVTKYGGVGLRNTMVRDVPPEIDREVNDLSLNFFEKLNPDFYRGFPVSLRRGFRNKLANSKIEVYNELDRCEYNKVCSMLFKWYPSLRSGE